MENFGLFEYSYCLMGINQTIDTKLKGQLRKVLATGGGNWQFFCPID
jgi:hypothetical protein